MTAVLREAATVEGAPLVGLWPALATDVLGVLERAAAVEGDLVRLPLPGGPLLVVLKHPRDLRRLLVENAINTARTPFHDRLRVALGDGLLNSEGELWARQRRKLQPLFQAAALRGYASMMSDCSRTLVERWRAAGEGAVVEAERDLSRLTMEIASRTLFGHEAEHGDIFDAVTAARVEVARRQFWPFDPPAWLPVPGARRLRDALARLDAEVARIARASAHVDGGIVGRLARDGDVPPKLVRDEAMSFFLAGHETSAAGLAWAVHLLADRPDIQADLGREADAVLGETPRVEADAVDRLGRIRAAVDETLRLLPPVPWFARRLVAADRFADVELPPAALVLASPWITQRDPRWWPEPTSFRLERFLPEAPKPAPLTYFPFAAGPRTCIGLAFARMEMTIALALVLRALQLRPAPGPPPTPRAEITLRPEPPIRLVVTPRP